MKPNLMANPNLTIDIDKILVHSINVNSIIGKVRRHHLACHLVQFKPDIVLLSETCLNKYHKLQFSNYSSIRTDKSAGTRGTGILIKSRFVHKVVLLKNVSSFEYTAIEIKCTNGSKLLVVSVYASHNTQFDDLSKNFERMNNYNYIICGSDLNARHVNWSNYITNENCTFYNSESYG